jgi:hypothetical protein
VVITDEMVWAHLPKAAGTATQEMIAGVPGLVLFQMPIDSNDKHDAFWAHGEAIEGKMRAMNIRRLPSWVLSAAHHKATMGVYPEYEPLPLPSAEEMAETTEPDDVLRWMTNGVPVDRWLRTEVLNEDVVALLVEIGVKRSVARKAVEAVPWVGKRYDHDVNNRFTPDQIRGLYERNPDWAAAEIAVYGSIPGP